MVANVCNACVFVSWNEREYEKCSLKFTISTQASRRSMFNAWGWMYRERDKKEKAVSKDIMREKESVKRQKDISNTYIYIYSATLVTASMIWTFHRIHVQMVGRGMKILSSVNLFNPYSFRSLIFLKKSTPSRVYHWTI